MADDTPLLDTLAAMTLASVENSSLEPRELMLARIAALAAVGAPAASYLVNAGTASDTGITPEDVQGLLIAVAPIVGTALTVTAAGNITRSAGVRHRRGGRGARGRGRRGLSDQATDDPRSGASGSPRAQVRNAPKRREPMRSTMAPHRTCAASATPGRRTLRHVRRRLPDGGDR